MHTSSKSLHQALARNVRDNPVITIALRKKSHSFSLSKNKCNHSQVISETNGKSVTALEFAQPGRENVFKGLKEFIVRRHKRTKLHMSNMSFHK